MSTAVEQSGARASGKPKAENRRRSRKDTTDWVAEKLWTERGKSKAGPKASLAENGMESTIRENAFAIL